MKISDENKERLKKASSEADTLTDSLLGKVAASPLSWLVLAVSHIIAFGIGAWFF